MRRQTIEPRQNWLTTVQAQGLAYAMTTNAEGRTYAYWDESAYYEFPLAEIEYLETVVGELHEMCLAAAEHVVATRRFADFGIHDQAVAAMVAWSWRNRDRLPTVYGRFDLRYDGSGSATLLEYNADTPTSVIETASAQWFWMEERFTGADQWNSLHERLVDAWQTQADALPAGGVHFAYPGNDEDGEDFLTTAYLAECASQAGIEAILIALEDIGWDPRGRRFVDADDQTIEALFKLYPWEWLVDDAFGRHALELGGTGPLWIEPAWKMLWSNKALLAVLWELFPGHPHLLPAYMDGPRELAATGYVAKPLHGREGSGVRIVTPRGEVTAPIADGAPRYGAEGYCYQAFAPLPEFDGNHPVLGAWVVGGEPAGMGIRESAGLITDLGARFVPHIIPADSR